MTPGVGSVDDSKLRPQVPRIEWIQRPRLLARLSESVQQPVTLVAAPAGYGKSTLVTQWFDDPEAAGLKAWITLDAGDNDPTRLWAHVATALERIGCWPEPNAAGYVASSSTAILAQVLPRVVDALTASSLPVTIVLDDCHLSARPTCCEQLDHLVEHLPHKRIWCSLPGRTPRSDWAGCGWTVGCRRSGARTCPSRPVRPRSCSVLPASSSPTALWRSSGDEPRAGRRPSTWAC